MSVASLDGVTKSFGSRRVLDNVSFEFLVGAYVIVGENGCGKTTLLNLLAGYLPCDSGTVTVPARIGYLFQDEMLFSNLSVRDNLLIRLIALNRPHDTYEKLISESLGRLEVDDLINRKVSMLSGGERQRVELASILISDPDLVLMDEPTSRLDERNRRNVAVLIQEVFAHTAVVIVTHDAGLFSDMCVKLRLNQGLSLSE